MDWKARTLLKKQKIEQERTRLLAISDEDALNLTISEGYQRMRYLREIEANDWVDRLQGKKPFQELKKRYAHPAKFFYEKSDD